MSYLSYLNPLSYFEYFTPSLGGSAPPDFEKQPNTLKNFNRANYPTFTDEFLQNALKNLKKVPPPAPLFLTEFNPYCRTVSEVPHSPVLSELLRKTVRAV